MPCLAPGTDAFRAIPLVLLGLLASCAPERVAPPQTPVYLTTIHPLTAIFSELTEGRAQVVTLLPPGASPHTYDLRPSDMRAAQEALALFFVHPALEGWATKLPTRLEPIFKAIPPEHVKTPEWVHDMAMTPGPSDLHFWTDPVVVRATVPQLAQLLAQIDPEGHAAYEENARRFALELEGFHMEIAKNLEPVKGSYVIIIHPSVESFLTRYGIHIAAVIQPAPGKEPTPKDLKAVIDAGRARNAKAIFTEPQLPRRPAEVVAEAAGIPVFELDPLGGVEGRVTYRELMLYNARIVRAALQ